MEHNELLKKYGIGLTGGIATGKSTVAKLIANAGYLVIDADQLAREAVKPNTEGLKKVVDAFGTFICDTQGQLDRKKLRTIVFASEEKRKILEGILHPEIQKLLKERLEKEGLIKKPRIWFYEASLLFEAGLHQRFRGVWLTTCSYKEQLRRVMSRDQISEIEGRRMIDAQWPSRKKEDLANQLIDTGRGDVASLATYVNKLLSSFSQPSVLRAITKSPGEWVPVQPMGGPSSGSKKTMQAVAQTAEEFKSYFEYAEKRRAMPAAPAGETLSLDDWQEEAIEALFQGANVIVDAPTTAGKTRVVESYFARNIHDPSFRACFTCPVKSLSNDKVKEFRALFGEHLVGVATGDIKENLDAPIVVSTLETYRNSLLGTEPDLGRKLVIFDEYHYLQDDSRGSAWEEAMILTPPSCQILLASASIANPIDFAKWLETLSGRPSRVISVSKRPVPLVDVVWHDGHWISAQFLPKDAGKKKDLKKDSALQVISPKALCPSIAQLVNLQLTPCLIYAGKRAACEQLAYEMLNHAPLLSEHESSLIRTNLEATHQIYHCFDLMDKDLRLMIEKHGVVFHHSGLTPPVRIAIENLIKEGLVRFCFATMGLSLGINFSVRSTLISDQMRPSEKGMTPYNASEVLQMKGRAGRRGRDAVGFSLYTDAGIFRRWSEAKRTPCHSNLKVDPITILGLIGRGYSLGHIEQFYRKSFLKFKNPSIHMALPSREKVEKRLDASLPCNSPSHEFIAFETKKYSLCDTCSLRKACHKDLRNPSQMGRILLHLQRIGALDEQDRLTPYGDLARYFPQTGGLLVAHMIRDGQINDGNLLATAQFLASLSMARHKSPQVDPSYKFPFKADELEWKLEEYYPIELFMDSYDPPWGRRMYPVLREFNPSAGYIIREWAMGVDWASLSKQVTHEAFGEGDVVHLVYRVASFLQAMTQVPDKVLAETAFELRSALLREPVSFLL